VQSAADALVDIGERYGLPVANYRKGTPAGATAASGRKLFGHMLQLFVHKDYVDQLAYASKPYGVPVDGFDSIKAYASRSPVSGQARIFMDPSMFTDESKTQVVHYCSWPEFCSDEETAAAGSTRGAMRAEMRESLKNLLGNSLALQRAKTAIES